MKANMAVSLSTKLFCNSVQIPKAIRLVRHLQTTSCVRGLDEFFPPGALDMGELAPENVKTGRRWRAGELRIKSNDDLHKLWYVLLKERNMLNTVMHEAKRQGVPMPSPERYHKVKKSMAMIRLVLGERENALQDLEHQQWPFERKEEQNTEDTSQRAIDCNEDSTKHQQARDNQETIIVKTNRVETLEGQSIPTTSKEDRKRAWSQLWRAA